jgi:superfamily II DNA or RNA helicase
MSYFVDRYPDIRLPVATDAEPLGFRNAQLGAIHAVASHFTLRDEPALITLPTGAGKTAVLLACAILLQPRTRVLLVTPSRALRNQVANEARTMATLRRIGALPNAVRLPKVHEVQHRLRHQADWDSLRNFDIVVGTPPSLSPQAFEVAEPPADLFDLVLMDEAHHSPAPTWAALLAAFPEAKKILCTATPFRLDQQEIRAISVYDYSLHRALDDGIICPLEYVPVWPAPDEPADMALARRAEQVLAKARQEQKRRREASEEAPDSPPYCLLVRTDSRGHADDLLTLYSGHTQLHLQAIHSRHSQRHIEGCIRKLKSGGLDGLLCVDMLGEGFDFPPLKVAAIHRKHKTLPVTLQFVGRFGRVTGLHGSARQQERAYLLAVPEELEGEIRRLYSEGTSWERLIPTLHASRLDHDRWLRRTLDSFEEERAPGLVEVDELSLWSLSPLAHVKIYQILDGTPVDIGVKIELEGYRAAYYAVSRELSAAVLVTREATTPRWSHLPAFDRVEYDLFVVVWFEPGGLLFINSSRRQSIQLYEDIATSLSGGAHRILPLYKVNRVIRDLEDFHCFNLGMRNRQVSQFTESYRIVAGREAERSVAPSDGRLFHRGHVFSRALEGGERITLGYSSSSKVWQSGYLQIPELVRWCQTLGRKILSTKPVQTGSNLEYLPVGEELRSVPEDLVFADWDDEAYRRPLRLLWEQGGMERSCEVLDASWEVQRESRTERLASLLLEAADQRWSVAFSLDEPRLYRAQGSLPLPRVVSYQDEAKLLDFLQHYPLNLYTSRFARCHGLEIFQPPASDFSPLDPARLEAYGWQDHGVAIRREFGWKPGLEYRTAGFDTTTIHGHLAGKLAGNGDEVLFYDHGPGETADFITASGAGNETRVRLYHVKGAGGDQPGNRVGDAYEVCGQVVKSLIWVKKPEELATRLAERSVGSSFFIRGDLSALQRLLGDRSRAVRFEVGLVQPGISSSEVQPRILEILAAADDYVRRAVGQPIFVLCSP